MTTLHTVNKSPTDRNTLEACLRLAKEGSSVLMIEDGVYGALKGTQKSGIVKDAMKGIKFYVLGGDLKARGIDESKLIDGMKVIDYAGFVNLAAENDRVQSWL
ncbi:MAG TPA: sulfurtransferase complex subunit TusB [Acidiferrobacteraceae bacterium]|nr:sulfurtransferase complex subunit TusB [Acidiferrobacteraceae bacterium]HEX20296.1 sulfurtransferase complex subunit TusB [Acidiferrobacteraceae bacterium]